MVTDGVKVEVKEPIGEELMEEVEDKEGTRVRVIDGEREDSNVRVNVTPLVNVSTGD